MKLNYIIWFINGCVFPFVAILFYENHNAISAFEHEYSMIKDIVFVIILIEQILCVLISWKSLEGKFFSKIVGLLRMSMVWILGMIFVGICVAILS